jgi:hypothetical protein
MHIANRHVERWAPESSASRVRSMRSLGFVDRLVAPWLETSQRSMGLRMFSSPTHAQSNERNTQSVSWVFPRPWYQDELDWMAAAREQSEMAMVSGGAALPSMLTTRGTYVAPQAQQRSSTVMPSALYEYVAPSLSVAQPSPTTRAQQQAAAFAAPASQAYSPLVSLAAVQAAELMNRAVAPLMMSSSSATPAQMATQGAQPQAAMSTQMGRVSPALRTVLTTMLERASVPTAPAAASMRAPEMVTPPSPTDEPIADETPAASTASTVMAQQVASDLHTQRVQMAQVQAIAQQHQQAARIAEAQVVAQRTDVERQRIERTTAPVAPTALPVSSTHVAPVAPTSVVPTAVEPTPIVAVAPVAAPLAPADAERARIEERVLARVAERVAAQRLHEGARAEAALHARSLEEPLEAPVAPPVQPPAEILAAIATLPPQLAAVLTENLRQPGGAVRAIAQVNEALRTAELMAYSAATNTAFEPTRGPRLMMPAGLGGLVSTVDRAHGPMMPMTAGIAAPSAMSPDAPAMARAQTERTYRVPTLPWIAAPTAPTAIGASSMTMSPAARMAPTSALGAATTAAPQALTQLAWADRWLARFAGASTRSLDAMQVASSTSPLLQLASSAPETVFVSSMFDEPARETQRATTTAATGAMATGTTAATPSMPARMPTLIPAAPPPIQRFDDSAETPDDVFAQISASVTRARKAPVASQDVTTQAPVEAAAPTITERPTYADHVAQTVPSAPHAGLAAQLASSPFAPALRHILALPSAPSFDVRSLFGGGLSATYLAGLLAPSSSELAVSSLVPAWAQWSPLAEGRDGVAPTAERAVPSFDAAYVAPDEVAADVAAGTPSIASSREAASSPDAASPFAPAVASQIARASELAPLTTMRSALLSWTTDVGPSAMTSMTSMAAPTIESVTSQSLAPSSAAPSPARSMLQSMSLPMVGETEPSSIGGWTSPGAIADRAFGYSLAHERSTADLSFDFVPPELVLAARVYGLGPAEAAQAARLALAGPGQLTAMANTVDRTFVNAMAIEAERREGRTVTTAYPSRTGDAAPRMTPAMPVIAPVEGAQAPSAVASAAAAALATPSTTTPSTIEPNLIGSATHSAFGVERRAPRGAFLWPAATVAALGLTASSPDGEQSMSVAALELLAAQAVAEIGTYAALDDDRDFASSEGAPGESRAATSSIARATSTDAARTMTADAALSAPRAASESASGEPAEADVLGTASTMIAPSRRARFDALYVALSQSPSGRNLSPAARAARALALAGRGEDAPASAFERAATVWDVLPVVYATEGMSTEEAVHTQAELGANTPRGIAARAALRRPGLGGVATDFLAAEGRPGLAPLSSRAGEALASYVTSVMVPSVPVGSTSAASSSSIPMSQRAPSAAAELVQTGRPSGRHGGGEPEIPPWFEAAARKMLGERMGTESLSLAELTLVNNAPSTQIAAASKTGHVSAAPTAPGAGGGDQGESKKGDDDVDAIAEEVYLKILIMMDAARSRNGEPYL